MSARFLIAAGGTGGHIQPALAVAAELKAQLPSAQIDFVGGRRGIEKRLVPAAGFPLHRLPAAGLCGLGWIGAVRFSLHFGAALLLAVPLVLRLRPHAVLATGGYASAAPAVAAALMGRPLWLQEQNAVPGATNRFLSRFAERAYVGFAEAKAALSRAGRVELLPNPVRREILQARGRKPSAELYRRFSLRPARRTLLVFGGSRGARRLNEAVAAAFSEEGTGAGWQALVQTGEEGYPTLREVAERNQDLSATPYIDDMADAYVVADLVVCRAGAVTLAELAAVGKPAILVPFPHATDDHQMRNATAFAGKGGARVVPDADFDGRRLTALLEEFQRTPATLETMGEAAAKIAAGHNGAAELAAALISRVEKGVHP